MIFEYFLNDQHLIGDWVSYPVICDQIYAWFGQEPQSQFGVISFKFVIISFMHGSFQSCERISNIRVGPVGASAKPVNEPCCQITNTCVHKDEVNVLTLTYEIVFKHLPYVNHLGSYPEYYSKFVLIQLQSAVILLLCSLPQIGLYFFQLLSRMYVPSHNTSARKLQPDPQKCDQLFSISLLLVVFFNMS